MHLNDQRLGNVCVLCRPQTNHLQHKQQGVLADLGAMSPETSHELPRAATRPLPPLLTQHSEFPRLPATAPLTYHLAMQVCLASRPQDRLSFSQIARILHCLLKEVASGVYIDTRGQLQVRYHICMHACSVCQCLRLLPGVY